MSRTRLTPRGENVVCTLVLLTCLIALYLGGNAGLHKVGL